MDDKLTIFIALVAVAILIQAGVLLGIFLAVKRLQGVAEDLQTRATPLIEQGRGLMTDLSPKVRQISSDALRISVLAREQAEQFAQTAQSLNQRTRAHIDRADNLVNETIGKVERTTDAVQSKVMSPVRKVNGIIAGIAAAVDYLRGIDHASTPRHFGEGDFIG
jgi:methyl-accepting chemotaxis protein